MAKKPYGEVSLDSASFGLMIIGDFVALVLMFSVIIYFAHQFVANKYPCLCYTNENEESIFKRLKWPSLWIGKVSTRDKSQIAR